jgi:SAM-dependent methyltransferase
VAGAFDQAAGTYDDLYQANPVMAWLRRESLAALQQAFEPGSRLLEIGCGTGEEALALAQAGYQVVATDISPAMIEAARAKAQPAHGGQVTWLALPAGRLATVEDSYGTGAFDGAYASFGALNCEPDLAPVADALARLLKPGAHLVSSVMNRACAWEIGWGLAHLRPGEAFRRLRQGWLDAGLESPDGRLTVPTRYYSPRSFARAFEPDFRTILVRALPVLLPPPYLDHLLKRHGSLFARLEAWERRLRDHFPWSSLGDHTLMILAREGE